FPLGNFTKQEFRQMGSEVGHGALARQSESDEICFVPHNDYRACLRHKRLPPHAAIAPGSIIVSACRRVGRLLGYPYVTLGQRRCLSIALGKPMFVIAILPESNTVMLGEEHELEKSQAFVRDINLIKYASIEEPMEAITKIRYKDAGALSTITQQGNVMRVD